MPRRLERESLSRLLPSLDPTAPPPPPDPRASNDYADAALLLVDRWHLPLDDRCLPRTLSLYQCLRGEGLSVRMVFGVRPGRSIEEGHAWLELDGVPYLEPARRMQGFVPVFRHPADDPDPAPDEVGR